MREVTLVLGPHQERLCGDIMGVDAGALFCAENKIPMVLACGDFDSVLREQIPLIQSFSKEFVALNPVKDITDFSYALSRCDVYDVIRVVGGLGRRRDHEYINVLKASQDARIVLIDGLNRIQRLDAGIHTIQKRHYTYFSILVLRIGEITLENFKYPLEKRAIAPGDDYLTSNEIIGETGTLKLTGGPILIIQSNDPSIK